MLLHDFSDRAEEYVRLAQRAKSQHDKDFFTAMARAWYGIRDEPADNDQSAAPATMH
jgi:hypothetical protein